MRKIKSERGQSLVELAISLVVILWLLAGAVEFGLALFQYIQLRDAAQEGALYGSIHPFKNSNDADYNNIVDRVKNASSSPLDLANDPDVAITPSLPNGTNCVADGITVTITYQHRFFMPMAKLFAGGQDAITLRASVTDTILQSTC